MKSIILVRHGKSSWEYDIIDHERPLKPSGEQDAKLVANQFIKTNDIPQNIYSSTAKRAFKTCDIFLKVFNLSENFIKTNDNLYDFGGENAIDFIKALSNKIDCAMIFGHNHDYVQKSLHNLSYLKGL